MVPASQTERLVELLRASGADVSVHWDAGGHVITPGEIKAAQRWLSGEGD
jgi:predicted esterase